MRLSKILPLLVFALLAVIFGLFTKIARAEDAVPDPFVPCLEEETENPEFNSQRPYQASPCGGAPKAYYCSNDYIIHEKVSRQWRNDCTESGGIYTCPVDKTLVKDYQIYMSGVEFPILGNTQETSNSQDTSDEIDDAQKLNEYLTWYLAGANQKAEYGEDSSDKIIDFSGPLKKLTPSVLQELQRFKVLHEAGVKEEYTDSEEFKDPSLDTNPSKEGVQVDETFSHNQIAVCTTKNFAGIDNPWVGIERPTPCYGTDSKEGKAAGTNYRLVEWWEGKAVPLTKVFEVIPNWDGSERWSATTPPFPWQFEKDIYYQKAYREWRGHECLIIFGKLLCADLKIPGVAELHTNVWADFYQYIPLGTTADKNAKHPISGVRVQGLGQTIAGPPTDSKGNRLPDTYFVEQDPVLFYPHTQSSFDMLELLNTIHTPQDTGEDTGKKSSSAGKDFETGTCEIADVRSNPGDDLTFDNTKEKHKVDVRNVQIHVTQIECDNEVKNWFEKCGDKPTTIDSGANQVKNDCSRFPRCTGTVQVTIPTSPKIPYADQIWKDSVVAQNSAFRKIFPKIEEGSPVSCIADIPSVSNATYTTTAGTNLQAILTPDGRVSPDEAKLYFPHIGTTYEYFLKGIQTALRPKGYGEPITSGKLCESAQVGTGACKQWLFEEDGGQFYYDKVIQAANSTSCNGKTLNPAWALGIALNENGGLMSDKLDGSSSSHFGCNISQVQSIEEKISCMTNTLRNDCLAGKTDSEILQEYGYPSGYILFPVTILSPGSSPIFGAGFNTEAIKARLLTTNWFDTYKEKAPTFCSSSPTLEKSPVLP